MTSYWFFKMAAAVAQYYFRFRIYWCWDQNLLNHISSTSIVNIISIYSWDITTSGLENKCPPYWNSTSGFDLLRNLYFILYQPAKCRPNRSSHCGNITSYRFIKMADGVRYYFRFRICWYRCLQKVKVYEQTKFRRHISIDYWLLSIN